jgi:hypothetical protein
MPQARRGVLGPHYRFCTLRGSSRSAHRVAFGTEQSVHGPMNATHLLAALPDPSYWQNALHAFLAEKKRRSGSRRIAENYSRMLQHFCVAGCATSSAQVDHGAGPRNRSLASGRRLKAASPSSASCARWTGALCSSLQRTVRTTAGVSAPLHLGQFDPEGGQPDGPQALLPPVRCGGDL